ncbi:unnamed protein product [Linum tenue]|uniref:Uncharacterized protein n=2 Tax=Linum tenue TaxID=586396 RepID=A0AAV0GWP2_9ROSI|nr:unnamed protein product [Linum tenue]
MDLETENRIAAMLLREAAELRRQAEKEGVRAYLEKPTVRARPNSRFLTATVLGVQQANRVVEVNEMWRAREKEKDLGNQLGERSKGKKVEINKDRNIGESPRSSSKRLSVRGNDARPSCSSNDVVREGSRSMKEEGLKDEEIEEFLHSRVKRGRGAVGSRMDETGPYRPSGEDTIENPSSNEGREHHRAILGPEKPSSLKSSDSSEDEPDEDRRKKAKKKGKSERKHKSKAKSSSSSSSSRDNKKRKRKEEKRRQKQH